MIRTLTFKSRIALLLFALFSTAFAWGQTSLSGNGTEESPFIINNAEDWNTFATTATYWTSEVYVRLDADITVSSPVGTSGNKYSGTFDGNWHTVTFNCGTVGEPYNLECCAPFSYVNGATIKNLTVDGTIVSEMKYAAGLIGWAQSSNPVYITNCTSKVTIDCSKIKQKQNPSTPQDKFYDCSTGGFIGQIESGNVYFENCIFDGLIDKGERPEANRCAGFVSYINTGKIYYKNCTMAGTINLTSYISTFNRNGKNDFSNAYYINNYGDVTNCIQAPTTVPTDAIARKYSANSTVYYVPGAVVTGLEATTYSYIEGQPITLDLPTIEYYGKRLTRGTDYVIKIDGNQVDGDLTISTSGNHIVAIEGMGNYGGTQTTTIKVINFGSWAVLQEVLANDSDGDRYITLNNNISPNPETDIYLEVKGNVVLNLNGKTIDRHLTSPIAKGQVFRVTSGTNLTINGPGTIKGGYNKAEETDVDGGGIYNMGNLVLNNVTIKDNTCVKKVEGSESAEGRGGGIYSGSGSSLVINEGSITSNTAKGGGGGVYSDGAITFTMTDVLVEGNTSESKGGGIRVRTTGNVIANLTNCNIRFNQVTANVSQGGGVYLENGELVMNNCEIKGNQSTMQGAGFYSHKGKTTAVGCNISYNGTLFADDDNHGAGVCLYNNSNGTDSNIFIMDGGIIEANNCNYNGGGVYVYSGSKFQVKGNVRILDNYQGTIYGSHSFNNTYLAGESVVEVIGPLAEDAYIVITPHDNGGTCVNFAEGVPTEGALSHFALDNDEYRLIPVDGHIEYYKLYLWNESSTWNGTIATNLNGGLPTASNSVTINRGVKIPSGYAASANIITLGDYGEIIIADGGQLIHNDAVTATLQKNISAYTVLANQGESKTNGWYTIASPVTGDDLDKECVAIGEYDLYLYNEPTHYWWNAKDGSGHGFSNISNGHGYLYANEKNVTLNFTGPMQATSANVSVPLSYTEAADNLKGYNLVGNPFTCNLTSSDAILVGGSPLTTYMYVANGNEMVTATLSERPIQPGEGFFVQASGTGQNLVFNHEVSEPNKTAFIRIEAGDNSFMDRAYLQFGQGNTLHKMTINDDVPHLSIQQGRDDYASTTIKANHGTIPVSFKAATNGSYTITVSHEGMEMDYLHLIDNLTGADTDLLSEPSYTFTASNHDYASRFRLVYSSGTTTEESDNENFAFINDGQIILSGVIGDATVQLIDMNGRVVYCRDAVHTISTSGMTSGVYVLRLIQDDIVKTQKIVIG